MTRSTAARVLTVLTLLFLGRVLGQALVAFLAVGWLPGMDSWYSGLLSYRLLLPAQVAILIVQAVIGWAMWTGQPWIVRPRPRASRVLRGFSCVYALAMTVRLALTGTHVIPVVFHWVLAGYLYTLARVWEERPHSGPVSAGRTRLAAGR